MAFNTIDMRRTELREIGCGAVLLHGDDFEFLTPGAGSAVAGGENDWIASSAPGLRASYVLFRKSGPLNAVLAIDEVVPLIGEAQPVVPGGRARDSFFIAVGDRDVESALAEVRRIRGETAPRVTVELPIVAPAPRLAHVAVLIRDRGVRRDSPVGSFYHLGPQFDRKTKFPQKKNWLPGPGNAIMFRPPETID